MEINPGTSGNIPGRDFLRFGGYLFYDQQKIRRLCLGFGKRAAPRQPSGIWRVAQGNCPGLFGKAAGGIYAHI